MKNLQSPELAGGRVITRCITRSPVSSVRLKVPQRELAAVRELAAPINVGSWRVLRVIQHESCWPGLWAAGRSQGLGA